MTTISNHRTLRAALKTLELRDAAGQCEFRILRDGVALMNWQCDQRWSIFDVQINAQKRFGQCDRVRLLTADGTVEHEWPADLVFNGGAR